MLLLSEGDSASFGKVASDTAEASTLTRTASSLGAASLGGGGAGAPKSFEVPTGADDSAMGATFDFEFSWMKGVRSLVLFFS